MSDPGELLGHAVEGEGEPLLLLNGGMMSYASWQPVSDILARSYRLVLCDLRGQLMSPGRAPADLAGNVADLVALLDHLEIASAHVLGTSYGGEVALLLAALEPDRVRSLIVVTATDRADPEFARSAREGRELAAELRAGGDRGELHDRVVGEVYSQDFREKYAAELAARRDQVAGLPDAWWGGLEGIFAAVERFDLRPRLGAIRCPTLVVGAAHDQVIPPPRVIDLVSAIDDAETRIHPSSGHALVAEDPAWLADAALEFLGGIDNGPSGPE